MSETDWTLIEELSKRFDQVLGIASQEQMLILRDNFHVVHLIASGRFDEVLNEFFPAKGNDPARQIKLLEQLRHYELTAGKTRFLAALLETSGIDCDKLTWSMIGRKMLTTADRGRRLRCKLVRFSGPVSIREACAACSRVGYAPVRLPHMVQFADAYPGLLPEKLLAAGMVTSPKQKFAGRIGIPCLARKPDGSLVLHLLGAESLDAAAIDKTCVLLVERVALPDATEHAEMLGSDGFRTLSSMMEDMESWARNLPQLG